MFRGTARIGQRIGLCILVLSVLGGCASWFNPDRWSGQTNPMAEYQKKNPYGTDPQYMDPSITGDYRNVPAGQQRSLLAELFAPSTKTDQGGSFIGVNTFLWHASLDTVSFMPIASADPFGGTIITDWYSPPSSPNERFKLNIFILSRDLRADGVRARVFRQVRTPQGQWVDAAVDAKTGTDIENAILTRARQIRMSTVAQQ